jgi:hypothetical protein
LLEIAVRKTRISIALILSFLASWGADCAWAQDSQQKNILPFVSEKIDLDDGRSVTLFEDGKYILEPSKRRFIITLTSLDRARGLMSNPDRDCKLSFDLVNFSGGTLYNFDANLSVRNKNKKWVEGVGFLEIDPFTFSDRVMKNGSRISLSVDVQETCENLEDIFIEGVSEKYCNFVGREEGDICKSMLFLENGLESVSFTNR